MLDSKQVSLLALRDFHSGTNAEGVVDDRQVLIMGIDFCEKKSYNLAIYFFYSTLRVSSLSSTSIPDDLMGCPSAGLFLHGLSVARGTHLGMSLAGLYSHCPHFLQVYH